MSDPTNQDLRAHLRRRKQELADEQRELLAHPNERQQELLTSLSRLSSPISAFQEEWFNETFLDIDRPFRRAALDQAKETLGVGKPDTELDKFQIATIRLIDTIHGYFSGDHAVTLVDGARATCEVISGLMKDFQTDGLLPEDMQRNYKHPKEITKDADEHTLISNNLHKKSRDNSNSAKHADRDVRKVRSYSDTINLQHLMYSMVGDYESLHCGLLKAELLSTDLERLVPVERSLLVTNGHAYRKMYDPKHIETHNHGDEQQVSMASMFIDVANQFDTREVYVPAATFACLLFFKDGLSARHNPETRDAALKTLTDLRIWPISVSSNARIVRDPKILDLNESPPRPQ